MGKRPIPIHATHRAYSMAVRSCGAAFVFTRIDAAMSVSSANAGNRTHDEAPRKRRNCVDAAFISSVIWRAACVFHSALAADEPGVVLAMRSVAWTT